MGILLWLVLGALAGWIASKIIGSDDGQGVITNIIVGIVGAFIGGFVFNLLGGDSVTGFNVYSLFVAVVGSVILLAILRLVRS
ncbi:MAG: GlsB/YeaQ/YmgE family stress response membrane protein [bacterium]|nr:GlsB/YeaQ/YmgE family stress response membrane protein [bacterium]